MNAAAGDVANPSTGARRSSPPKAPEIPQTPATMTTMSVLVEEQLSHFSQQCAEGAGSIRRDRTGRRRRARVFGAREK